MNNENLYYVMDDFGKTLVDEIKKKLQETGKGGMKRFVDSITYKLNERREGGWELEITEDHWARTPGAKQPPSDKLIPWVSSKGMGVGTYNGYKTTVEGTAFVVARHVGKVGIAGTKILTESITKPIYDSIYQNYKERIAEARKKDLMKEIKNIFNE